jgi:hypothetical protein
MPGELNLNNTNQQVVVHTSFYQKTVGQGYDFTPSDPSATPYVWRLGQIAEAFRKPDFLKAPPSPQQFKTWEPPAYGGGSELVADQTQTPTSGTLQAPTKK